MSRLTATAAAAAATVALVMGTAGGASATSYPNKLNLYEDTGYHGHLEARTSYDSNFGNDMYGGGWGKAHSFNDAASSLNNRSGAWWKLYRDKGYGGPVVCIKPHSHVADLKPRRLSDWISSVKKYGASKPSGCTTVIGTAN